MQRNSGGKCWFGVELICMIAGIGACEFYCRRSNTSDLNMCECLFIAVSLLIIFVVIAYLMPES